MSEYPVSKTSSSHSPQLTSAVQKGDHTQKNRAAHPSSTIEKSITSGQLPISSSEMDFPRLPEPFKERLMYDFQEKKQAVIRGFFENWNKNLEETAAYIRAKLNSPSYIKLMETQRPGKGELMDKSSVIALSYVEAYLNPIQEAVQRMRSQFPEGSFPLIFSPMLYLPSFLARGSNDALKLSLEKRREHEPTGNVSNSQLGFKRHDLVRELELVFSLGGSDKKYQKRLSASEIENEAVKAKSPVQDHMTHPILAQTVPLINPLLMTLTYFTAWETGKESVNKTEKQVDLKMAENFAREVIKLATNDALLKELFSTAGEQNSQLLYTFGKLILSSVALSLIYIVEAGKITPEEFVGMLKGEIPVEKGSLKATLILLIKSQLQNLTPEDRAVILEDLFEYIENSPNPNEMLIPAKVFQRIKLRTGSSEILT